MAQIADLQKQLAKQEETPVKWCHTFNTNLKFGDEGKEVQALHEALLKEGFIEKPSGVFEETTASAVVAFQEKYASEVLAPWGLAHGTGVVGPTTRKKLNSLYGCGVTVPPTTTPSITVLSPNGGETLTEGQQLEIKWAAANIPSANLFSIDLEDEKGNAIWGITNKLPPDQRSYVWTVRFPYLFSGAKYKIAISTWQTLSAGVEDQSDNYFSIVAATTATPSITVVSPNGGEQWTAGNTYPIKIYCSANLPGKTLNISLSNYSTKDFGYILKDLTCRLGDTSTYNWTIPSNYTQGSAFKITVSNDLVSDESNNYFSIISATTTAGSLDISSNVNSPSGTITLDSNRELFRVNFYTYTKGSEDIKVNSLRLCVFKTPNNVPATDADISKLRLYDSMNLTSIMAEGYFATALNGCSQFDNFNWVVPGVGTKTLVVKGDVTNSAVIYLTIEGKYINAVGMSSGKTILVPNSVTSNALTVGSGIIVTPSITVLSPNGGEQWAFGLPQTITWKATGIENGQDVGVYLQFPDGGLCRVAERNALDGIQTVTLSQNQSCPNISKTLASGQYKVFVYWESSVKNERAEDASDNYFNIVAGGYPGFFMTPDKYSYSSGETINLKINRADNKTFPYFVDLFVINQSDSSKNSERYNLDVTSPITVRIHTANSGVFTTSGNYTLLICAGGEVCGAGANTNGTAIYYSAIVPNVSPTAPVIEIPFGDERVIGSGILFSFTSKDPDEKNQLQFYIVWGDGSSDTCLATATGGSAVCAKLHAYSNAGTYRITADVVDSNGGAPREVSTFDVVINDASVGSITSENQLADISSALLKMADEINKLLGR